MVTGRDVLRLKCTILPVQVPAVVVLPVQQSKTNLALVVVRVQHTVKVIVVYACFVNFNNYYT